MLQQLPFRFAITLTEAVGSALLLFVANPVPELRFLLIGVQG